METSNSDNNTSNNNQTTDQLQESVLDYAHIVFHSELEPLVVDSFRTQLRITQPDMSMTDTGRSPHVSTEEREALLHRMLNNYGTTGDDDQDANTPAQDTSETSSVEEEHDGPPGLVPGDYSSDGSESSSPGEATASNTAEDEEQSTDGEDERESRVSALTRRLRCLFSTITWPIVPLGTIVALALLWVLYAASSLDLRRTCSHPLHWYALASLTLVAYIPFHAQIRSHLFSYQRERDGPIRPARVRMFDQLFHTVCLLYVYTGVTLIQTCREDIVTGQDDKNVEGNEIAMPTDGPLNTCQATCPNLYQALSVYVATLEMFTFALILPLLFLPCIYLWFLRRATAEAEAFAQLQDRLQEEEALLSNGGVTTGDIMDNTEHVKLVSKRSANHTTTHDNDDHGNGNNTLLEEDDEPEIWLLPYSATDASIGTKSDIKECCICMNDFPIHSEGDLEAGLFRNNSNDGLSSGGESDRSMDVSQSSSASSNSDDSVVVLEKECVIVRTKCGHVFHKECLAGWVGGRWQMNATASDANSDDASAQIRMRRRARQTCCPLCREDLRPSNR